MTLNWMNLLMKPAFMLLILTTFGVLYTKILVIISYSRRFIFIMIFDIFALSWTSTGKAGNVSVSDFFLMKKGYFLCFRCILTSPHYVTSLPEAHVFQWVRADTKSQAPETLQVRRITNLVWRWSGIHEKWRRWTFRVYILRQLVWDWGRMLGKRSKT
jgi:hypothetical protein